MGADVVLRVKALTMERLSETFGFGCRQSVIARAKQPHAPGKIVAHLRKLTTRGGVGRLLPRAK